MNVKDVLEQLKLGASVAEFDEKLDSYFVDTEAFRELIFGNIDIIAGDKGTGKTALFRTMVARAPGISELARTEIITGFNPVGNPIFQRLIQLPALTESQYIALWKNYLFSLIGNHLLSVNDGGLKPDMKQIDQLLRRSGMRSIDAQAETVFSKIVNSFARLFHPASAEVEVGISEAGTHTIKPKIDWSEAEQDSKSEEIDVEQGLRLLERYLQGDNQKVWVALDRLDEAFPGSPTIEVPALRALFRTYLDLQAYPAFRLKLFVRKDLFRRIIKNGFVNLTHVNARKFEIVWDEEDLMALLIARIHESGQFGDATHIEHLSNQEVFYRIFPDKVFQRENQSTTWKWMMARIRDGNDIKAPRSLIDLIEKARQNQLRSEVRDPQVLTAGRPLINADSVKRAHSALSTQRVEDTLLAEAADLSPIIEKFRNGKSEQTVATIAAIVGMDEQHIKPVIQALKDIGFLEEIGSSYKVPPLYRDGLSMTQGKAIVGQA